MKPLPDLEEVCTECGLTGFYKHCDQSGCKGKLQLILHADFSKDIRRHTRGVGEFKFSNRGGMYWTK